MNRVGRAIAATWHWLGGPWRTLKTLCVALVSMDRRRMRSLFSLAMLGGIIALSFQNGFLILMVRELLGEARPGSLFGQMALNQQFWNNVIIVVFCVAMALVVWGADYFSAKFKDVEVGAGNRHADRVAGAKEVKEAAENKLDEIEDEIQPGERAMPTFEKSEEGQ